MINLSSLLHSAFADGQHKFWKRNVTLNCGMFSHFQILHELLKKGFLTKKLIRKMVFKNWVKVNVFLLSPYLMKRSAGNRLQISLLVLSNLSKLINFRPFGISKQDISWFVWFQQAFNDKVVIARCIVRYWQIFSSFLIFCYYFTRLKAREVSCKIWETRKIFPMLQSAPCHNNYLYDNLDKAFKKMVGQLY